jgi:hypothetical protein
MAPEPRRVDQSGAFSGALRQSDEYKAAMREMRRLTDLSDPKN